MATGDTVLTLAQTVAGYTGDSALYLTQFVIASGDVSMTLAQTVAYPAGDAVLALTQTGIASADTALVLTQNVFDPAAFDWRQWDVVITVNGNDVSSQLVEVGRVLVEMERSAARIAQFTVALSGVVDVLAWTGKPVTIDYVQPDGGHWRLFTGILSEPVLDIATKTLRCTCTDDLQRIADGHSVDQLQALTGGIFSKYVLNESSLGYQRLQDLLTTVEKSAQLDESGTWQVNSFAAKASADYSFDETQILDDSLTVALVQRSNLINRVNIKLSARFERLFHRVEAMRWTWEKTFCESHGHAYKYPTLDIIEGAINDAGWQMLTLSHDPLWPSGVYNCNNDLQPIYWNNLAPDKVCRGFYTTAAFRWQQSVTNEFNIAVTAPASVTAYGELADELQTAIDFKSTVDNWTDSATNWATVPAGFVQDDSRYDRYRDEIDLDALQEVAHCATAIAVQRINKTHRSNIVSFRLPLSPHLQLKHTIAVDDSNVQAKGVVNKIRHSLAFNAGSAEAVTDVELLISSGQSGQDVVTQAWATPTPPGLPAGDSLYIPTKIVPTVIGGLLISQPETDETWGWYTNENEMIVVSGPGPVQTWGWYKNIRLGHEGDPAVYYYQDKLELKFEAVDDAKTQNRTDPIAHTVNISVAHNPLTITA